ncbi:MAG: hypothetical protein ACTSU2_05590 [Promethearchaeota archaeon]
MKHSKEFNGKLDNFKDYLILMAQKFKVLVEPDKNQPEWWAGAPSVILESEDEDSTSFFVALRMRTADAPRGRRGYEIRIFRIKINFSKYLQRQNPNDILPSDFDAEIEKIKSIKRENVPQVKGFERAAIVKDPISHKFKFYGCGEMENGWGIFKFDDVDNLEELDERTYRTVLGPQTPKYKVDAASSHHAVTPIQYKDPFIIHLNSRWHMFVIGFDRIERAYHFISPDGEKWTYANGNPVPILENTGWHNFYTRPACLIPLDIGYILVYEGSNLSWHDPGYNIATGLAYSIDLKNFIDLTDKKPLLMTIAKPIISNLSCSKINKIGENNKVPEEFYITWRYSHWIRSKKHIYVFFEGVNQNKTNNLRFFML